MFCKAILVHLVLVIYQALEVEASASSWTYSGKYGPYNWAKTYPKCGLKRQSPINIWSEETRFKRAPIKTNYRGNKPWVTFSLANNGHAAQVTLGNIRNLHTLVFGQEFKPLQVHFHWGSRNDIGSEHTVNGWPYAAEMHFVHLNTKYSSISEAVKHPDGLLVLGTFIEVGRWNRQLQKIFRYLGKVEDRGKKVPIPGFDLRRIMPRNMHDFYFYDGSLTTPGCNQAVKWVLFCNPITISQYQMHRLRSLKGNHDRLINNFRPTQPLNGRKVYRTYHHSDFHFFHREIIRSNGFDRFSSFSFNH